jgi:hypothetical protein
VRSGGGQHHRPSRLSVLVEQRSGVGRDQRLQLLGRGPPDLAHGFPRPPTDGQDGASGQGHRGQRLAHDVEELVEQALAREPSSRSQARSHQGLADERAAGPSQERAVQVEEHGLGGCHRRTVPDATKGPAGGTPAPSLDRPEEQRGVTARLRTAVQTSGYGRPCDLSNS